MTTERNILPTQENQGLDNRLQSVAIAIYLIGTLSLQRQELVGDRFAKNLELASTTSM
jgi:hypothetical protein